jgi:hypothetical protein
MAYWRGSAQRIFASPGRLGALVVADAVPTAGRRFLVREFSVWPGGRQRRKARAEDLFAEMGAS